MTSSVSAQPPNKPHNGNGNTPLTTQHQWVPLHNDLITALSQKIAPYCTTDFLSKKAKAWMKAKICPLSTPDDLAKALTKANKHQSRLKLMHREFSKNLQDIKGNISYLERENSSSARLSTLKNLETHYENRIQGLTEAIKVTAQFINHLKTKQKTTISGRVAGYVGTAANLIVPGSGSSVNLALTITQTALPEVSASKLKDPQEKRNVHWATAFSAISFISTTALSYYVWPAVNAYVTSYFATQSQK